MSTAHCLRHHVCQVRYYLTVVDSISCHLSLVPLLVSSKPINPETTDVRVEFGVDQKSVLVSLCTILSVLGWLSQIFDKASYFEAVANTLNVNYNAQCQLLPANAAWRRGRVERPHRELNKTLKSCMSDPDGKLNAHEALSLCALELNSILKPEGFCTNDLARHSKACQHLFQRVTDPDEDANTPPYLKRSQVKSLAIKTRLLPYTSISGLKNTPI
jgi:hypothetical protein